MGLFELMNRASAVTMSAISVGIVLHIILPKNDAYYGFDIENQFLPRMYREDGTMERPRFEIQRGVVLLASIVFAGIYTNRLLLSTSQQ